MEILLFSWAKRCNQLSFSYVNRYVEKIYKCNVERGQSYTD